MVLKLRVGSEIRDQTSERRVGRRADNAVFNTHNTPIMDKVRMCCVQHLQHISAVFSILLRFQLFPAIFSVLSTFIIFWILYFDTFQFFVWNLHFAVFHFAVFFHFPAFFCILSIFWNVRHFFRRSSVFFLHFLEFHDIYLPNLKKKKKSSSIYILWI